MIFVTVGTHEQPFDRLVKYLDQRKESGLLQDEVVMQIGYGEYEPKHCRFSRFFAFQDMLQYVKEARIVITHGGPSSFIMALEEGKTPIVVPRQKQLSEHVNDHQLDFCRKLEEKDGNILVVENIEDLGPLIDRYEEIVTAMPKGRRSNNENFCRRLEEIVQELCGK